MYTDTLGTTGCVCMHTRAHTLALQCGRILKDCKQVHMTVTSRIPLNFRSPPSPRVPVPDAFGTGTRAKAELCFTVQCTTKSDSDAVIPLPVCAPL
uniref:Uncharacterized protein n=1 Tax=Anguilla anguilla TaxID=7936 RepID=A0A0E9WX30_ANGAN